MGNDMSDIIERIERAIHEFKASNTDRPAILRLGRRDAQLLYAWAMSNDVSRWLLSRQKSAMSLTPNEFLTIWTYNNLRIEQTFKRDGAEITS